MASWEHRNLLGHLLVDPEASNAVVDQLPDDPEIIQRTIAVLGENGWDMIGAANWDYRFRRQKGQELRRKWEYMSTQGQRQIRYRAIGEILLEEREADDKSMLNQGWLPVALVDGWRLYKRPVV